MIAKFLTLALLITASAPALAKPTLNTAKALAAIESTAEVKSIYKVYFAKHKTGKCDSHRNRTSNRLDEAFVSLPRRDLQMQMEMIEVTRAPKQLHAILQCRLPNNPSDTIAMGRRSK